MTSHKSLEEVAPPHYWDAIRAAINETRTQACTEDEIRSQVCRALIDLGCDAGEAANIADAVDIELAGR
jgi:hypothetical protein